MNWDAIGAIAEFISGVATVATLVYLALQIRENTRSVKIAAMSSFREGGADFMTTLAQNEDLNDIYMRGLADPDTLSMSEQQRFLWTILLALNHLQNSEEFEAFGLTSNTIRNSVNAQVNFFAKQPGFRKIWAEWKHSQSPELVQRMDSEIERLKLDS